MRHLLNFCILFILNGTLHAQGIKGTVSGTENKPLAGANIYVKNSYDGTITNADGNFEFNTSLTDTIILIVSFIGYENYENPLILNKQSTTNLHIQLKEKESQLKEVVITAGSFIAGDKKRGIQMSTLDILTTANSNGDIPSALGTLPGVQLVGEEGALFVRGGEKYETKTFVDGLLVTNPYTSKIPDLPTRGRFSPNAFTGVSFSSGGYSAEYGQALSSALILQSYIFPTKTFTSLSFMPFGTGFNQTLKGNSSSISLSVDYQNLSPYFSVIKQKTDWKHAPEGLNATLMLRKKIANNGLIKTFVSFADSHLGINLPEYLAYKNNVHLQLNNRDLYANTILSQQINSQWTLKSGVSVNYDDELIRFEKISVNTYNRAGQLKLILQDKWNQKLILKLGGEFNIQSYKQSYIQKDTALQATMNFISPLIGLFAEAEWRVSAKLFARIGTRLEYAGLIKETSAVPRFSLAYKTSENSQISLAYGIFTQLPQDNYLKFNSHLNNEKAAHYIINYEYSNNNRLFRVEAFSKEYTQLIRYTTLQNPDPNTYKNKGYGYARGIELFLRDQKSLRNGDYWISYTFLDTRKLYQDAPTLQRPYLFSKHCLSVVGKYYVSNLHTQFGLTYQYASGRPYYPTGDGTNIQNFTNDFHNVSANLSYLTRLFKCFTIVHFSVSNVFGFKEVFGYHSVYSESNKNYTSYPITPSAPRFFVIGVFVTLGSEYISN